MIFLKIDALRSPGIFMPYFFVPKATIIILSQYHNPISHRTLNKRPQGQNFPHGIARTGGSVFVAVTPGGLSCGFKGSGGIKIPREVHIYKVHNIPHGESKHTVT